MSLFARRILTSCVQPQRASLLARRSFSVAAPLRGEAPKAEKLPGFREEGAIATNYEIATGAERYEFMSKLEGAEPWEEMKPIVISKKGTKAEPVVVSGMDPVRYVACSGFPVDSHEAIWLTLNPGLNRCPDCGQAFLYNKIEEEHH